MLLVYDEDRPDLQGDRPPEIQTTNPHTPPELKAMGAFLKCLLQNKDDKNPNLIDESSRKNGNQCSSPQLRIYYIDRI